jgi:quercetin dioxygenase-like cupin family protein
MTRSLSASGQIELQDVRAGIGDKEVGPSGRRAGGDTVMISATSTGSSLGVGGMGEDGGMPDAIPPVNLAGLAAGGNHPGALWRLDGEDLQANLVRLGRGDRIEPHRNDEVDVLVVVVLGRGELTLDGQVHQLAPMVVAHLPKGTVRAVEPVDGPLVYLSIHRHRSAGLQVGRPPQRR